MIPGGWIHQLKRIMIRQSVHKVFAELSWVVFFIYTVKLSIYVGSPADQMMSFGLELMIESIVEQVSVKYW